MRISCLEIQLLKIKLILKYVIIWLLYNRDITDLQLVALTSFLALNFGVINGQWSYLLTVNCGDGDRGASGLK